MGLKSLGKKLSSKLTRKPGRWLVSQLLKGWTLDKVIAYALDLIWAAFGEVTETLEDLVNQAERKYPGKGYGRQKFDWVFVQIVSKFKYLQATSRKRLVNWLIETAVLRMEDSPRAVAQVAASANK